MIFKKNIETKTRKKSLNWQKSVFVFILALLPLTAVHALEGSEDEENNAAGSHQFINVQGARLLLPEFYNTLQEPQDRFEEYLLKEVAESSAKEMIQSKLATLPQDRLTKGFFLTVQLLMDHLPEQHTPDVLDIAISLPADTIPPLCLHLTAAEMWHILAEREVHGIVESGQVARLISEQDPIYPLYQIFQNHGIFNLVNQYIDRSLLSEHAQQTLVQVFSSNSRNVVKEDTINHIRDVSLAQDPDFFMVSDEMKAAWRGLFEYLRSL